ncbi:hypothetical protein, partial [Bacillus sp. JJ722]|uniref:hypothetical protein n=1 Tax=Bacillus sp. JJ722 TaxID=3122973 RepID=UPI00300074DE
MVENYEKKSKNILLFSLLAVFVLSFGHAFSNKGIILFALIGFATIVLLNPKENFLYIMLFFLPWSPIMKFSFGSLSFYTIIVPVFFVTLLLS